MLFSAVEHRTTDNYCYALDENNISINIRTGYDIDRCFIIHGDPFFDGIMGGADTWVGTRCEMSEKIRLRHGLLWSFTAVLEFKRCKYYFELHCGNEVFYYFEDGFYTKQQIESSLHIKQYFFFPWLNPSDINKPPEWVNDTVWYQIFPDRFCNGKPEINPPNTLPWASPSSPVNNTQIYGGDLYGILQKLDYLKDLGINGIYLTPINLSSSVHKYDTLDYEKIDPAFGDKAVLRELVLQAHKRNIRVMLDGVFNHTAWFNPMWLDVVRKGPDSKYYSWYMVNNWPFNLQKFDNAANGRFYSFSFFDGMPKLNTNNPEVIEYIINILVSWIREYGIDGIRLDVANEISHTLCRDMNARLKEIKPDFYIMGEIWHDSIDWLRGDQFDSVMNYPFEQSVADYFCDETQTARDFEFQINRCFSMYMLQTRDVLFNMLDSHDTIRLISRTYDINKYYQQMAVLFTMPGSACIYYGSEVVLEGDYDPDCRRCMPWKEISQGFYDSRIEKMKALIRLRHEHKAARSGKIVFESPSDDSRILRYKRCCGDDSLTVIINGTDIDVKFQNSKTVLFSNLYENETLSPGGVLIIES